MNSRLSIFSTKRSWRLLAGGAVFVLFSTGGLIVLTVSGVFRRSPPVTPPLVSEVPSAISTSSVLLVERTLDGVLVPAEEATLSVYAVTIENHPDARPVSGIVEAQLVHELPVEGGITRYLALYDATTTVDQMGPVRSARPYVVDLVQSIDAIYAHVGGSPDALDRISNARGFRDVNEFFQGKYFWRSSSRFAPHNTYTSSKLLREISEIKQWGAGEFRSWSYREDLPLEASSTASVRGTTEGPRIPYGGSYHVRWTYDREANQYLRSLGGSVHRDARGTRVVAKNVVVLATEGQVIDAVGRLRVRTTGRGKALLDTGGRRTEIQWVRAPGEHIRFETIDGNEALFQRGTTWVEWVIDPAEFEAARGS